VLAQASGNHSFAVTAQLVKVTAGEYFFVPSLTALAAVGSGASQ
jgi:hypothetical protein